MKINQNSLFSELKPSDEHGKIGLHHPCATGGQDHIPSHPLGSHEEY